MTNINIPVPFYSQRDNSYIWKQRYEEDKKNNLGEILHKKGEKVLKKVKNDKGEDITQEITEPVWDDCCNITCLAMVLNYLGITKDTPYQMSQKIFADRFSEKPEDSAYLADFDRYINYRKKANKSEAEGYNCIESAEVIKDIAKDIYGVRNAFTGYNYNLAKVKEEVEAGYPVIVSCGIIRPSIKWMKDAIDNNTAGKQTKRDYEKHKDDTRWEYRGHYIIIKGFTSDGDVIINDPWGKATNSAGKLPQKEIDSRPEDGWGAYPTNISNGSNKGENIIIKKDDFNRQYKNAFNAVIIIYDRRWSFPFNNVLTNFIKTGSDNNQRFVPSPEQVKKTFSYESKISRFPISTLGIPHNGIDLKNSKGVSVHSIGSGIVVAAKLCLKENEELPCGSNCFVLVKHIIFDTAKTLKNFFVLYEHLKPIKIENKETNIPFVDELLHESIQEINVLKQEAIDKLNKLKNGEIVIFNDSKIVSEVAENSIIGYVGTKGFLPWNEENRIHLEIFSNENLLKSLTEYKEVDITEIDIYDRSQVINKYKDVLFGDFAKDSDLKKYVRHLDKNAITIQGIDAFYNSEYSDIAEKLVIKSKSLWDSNRNFSNEFSKQKGFSDIIDEYITNVNDYDEKCVRPYLWWTDTVNKQINEDLEVKINNRTAYFFHPIIFLYWLMKNDEEVYKKICPNFYKKELVAK